MAATIDKVREHLRKHDPNNYRAGQKVMYIIEAKVRKGMVELMNTPIFWWGIKRTQNVTALEVDEVEEIIVETSDMAI
jgi:hypothetical protein